MLGAVDEVTALMSDLVAINSVNPGLVPGAPGEAEAVEFVRARLQGEGFATAIVTPEGHPHRPSLVAWTPPAAVTVLLNGHLDTVGVEGMSAPFAPEIDGDVLRGRGSCDMKGGCAALIVVAETLLRSQTDVQVVLALVADEEDQSLGTEAVLAALPRLGLAPDVAVVAEPTWLALAQSHRGYAVAEVDFVGRAAHSSQPEEGVNAVTHLGRLLGEVARRAEAIAAAGGALMATVAHGGAAPFTIPSSARAVIERRTIPGESAAQLVGEVEEMLTALKANDSTVQASARLTHAREAWQLADSGPSAALADCLRTELATRGAAPGAFAAPYWMESALWEAAGIPTVVCGPAGGGLHAVDEWGSLGQVRAYTSALVAALATWADEHGH